MAGHATNQIDSSTLWGGKISPFSTGYGKLMMWFFLVSDALTFGGFLIAFGFARFTAQEAWPIGEETFNALPFLGSGYPLVYVALMTFLLIMSSVTMVLAVEAGHRMDKRGVVKWLFATIIGGFFFVGSQAWEWSHFIHGTPFGRVELEDGSLATVHAKEFGEIENFTVTSAGHEYKVNQVLTNKDLDLLHSFQHAAAEGHIHGKEITLEDGSKAKINKKADQEMKLIIKKDGGKNKIGDVIEGEKASKMYYGAISNGEKNRVTYGANLKRNEYGPKVYANFFFFVTGFHGFHVSIGILLNIIVFINVLKGTYEKRGHYEMVEKSGLYWHFVDLVWVFVFTFFYLV
jgi:cytochrome c oxidase subunit 3